MKILDDIRKDILFMSEVIYFDNIVILFILKLVIEVMDEYYLKYCVNVYRGVYRFL